MAKISEWRDKYNRGELLPGQPNYKVPEPTDVTKQPFSWWNPGSWATGAHAPGTAPWEPHAEAPIPPRSGGSNTRVGPGGDPRNKEGVVRAAAIATGQNPDDVVAVARAEGLGVAGYGNWDVNAMSYGAMQMHIGGLATEYQKATGRDPTDPKNEDDLTYWGIAYAAKYGYGKWTSVTGGRVPTPRRMTASNASSPQPIASQYGPGQSLNRGFLVPPGTKFNSKGMPYAPQTSEDDARVAQSMAAIRAAQRSGVSWYRNSAAGANNTQNTNTTNAPQTFGDVNVHVPPGSDGYQIGGTVADTIQRRMLVNNANTGTGG